MLVAAVMLAACRLAAAEEPPMRDPMQPYHFAAGPGGALGAPRFALTAVLISPSRRVAIVNGKPYERGETVNGAEIVRIDADAVHLREHGTEVVVPLGRAGAADKPRSQGETVP
ncbi:MAG TPA: hypothetical protein VHH11_12780 [Gammaproteobacteria bacterium]|nr:hypothetical protein [Gammaproteobacteria bacterium]